MPIQLSHGRSGNINLDNAAEPDNGRSEQHLFEAKSINATQPNRG